MTRRLALASCGLLAAVPAWANAPMVGSVSLAPVLVMPILILMFTALGGAGKVMAAKGIRRWNMLEVAAGMTIMALPAVMLAPIIMLFISMTAAVRGIRMIIWGVLARKPIEERKPYLIEARPGRLIGAGAGLIAAAVVLSAFCWKSSMHDYSRMDSAPTKGNMGAIRSALGIYYGDMEGVYPPTLDALTISGKYLQSIPGNSMEFHPRSNLVRFGKIADDAGGWLYNNDVEDENFGLLIVNCTHKDWKGTSWTEY
ncbi:MAG: hypothetical protein WC943_13315 [Elusimicrobiota bacterium]|jgi:hypothetical protein